MDIEQALQQLQRAQNDPQALTLATAQIACNALEPQLFEILQIAAIPHWFDAGALSHLLDINHETAEYWMQLLTKLPMVESYAARNAWNVHETTRLAIRAELAKQQRQRFQQLSASCSEFFAGDTVAETVERIFHRLAAGSAGTERQLLTLYHDWRGAYDAHQALSLALRELLTAKVLDGAALARTLLVNGWILGSRLSAVEAETMARQAVELFLKTEDDYGEADARSWLGRTLQTEGKSERALQEFRKQLSIMLDLAELDPNNNDWQRDVVAAHFDIGSVLYTQGNQAGALTEYQAGMVIMHRLCDRDPDNSDWQRDLSVSHDNIGRVLQAKGNLAGALTEYQACIGIMCSLCEQEPDNSDWQRELSVSHNNIGGVLKVQGNLADALTEYQAGMGIMLRLCERDPDNSDWQRELSVAYNCIGSVLQDQGNLAEALNAYQTGLAIMLKLIGLDSDNCGWQRDLGLLHSWVGSVLERQGQLSLALPHWETYLAISMRLVKLDPTNQQWQEDLKASQEVCEALKLRLATIPNKPSSVFQRFIKRLFE